MLLKRHDGMPSYTSSYNVCSTRVMIASQARHRSTICASKVYDCMTCPTSSERVCCTRTIMAFHARLHPTMFAAKGPCGHPTPYVVQLCVQSMGNGIMLRRRLLIVCVVQGDDDMPRSTSFDRVCSPRTMVACHVKHCSTLCSFKEE